MSDKADSRAVRAELERALASGQVHGAYLFHGPPGTGKRATAFWLAERLLGLSPRDDGEEARHPDLHVVEPDGAGASSPSSSASTAAAVRARAAASPADAPPLIPGRALRWWRRRPDPG